MKAILVIDEMPTGCIGCPCYYEDKGRCQNTWESVEDDYARPSWCPLRPLPQKKDLLFNELHFEEGYIKERCTHGWKDFVKEKLTEYDMGYNACIDEILGEEE